MKTSVTTMPMSTTTPIPNKTNNVVFDFFGAGGTLGAGGIGGTGGKSGCGAVFANACCVSAGWGTASSGRGNGLPQEEQNTALPACCLPHLLQNILQITPFGVFSVYVSVFRVLSWNQHAKQNCFLVYAA